MLWIDKSLALPENSFSVLGWVIGGCLHMGQNYAEIVTYWPKTKSWTSCTGIEDSEVVVSHWSYINKPD